VDFPVVYRAMAGIDSIAQAAGRCNREGKRPTTESFVYVFESTDAKPPPELAQYADVAREIIRQYGSNILSHAAIEDYFRKLYWRKEVGSGQSELDKKDILGKLKERANTLLFPFATIARDFQMIESGMAPVIVPYEGEGRRLLKNLHSLPEGVPVGRLARQLQPYTVQIPPPALSRLMAAGAIQAVRPERFGDQFMELLNGDLYRQDVGLTWDDPTYRSIESGIF
jgi:CRISPR-associated endonuclease/helicase Cas3